MAGERVGPAIDRIRHMGNRYCTILDNIDSCEMSTIALLSEESPLVRQALELVANDASQENRDQLHPFKNQQTETPTVDES